MDIYVLKTITLQINHTHNHAALGIKRQILKSKMLVKRTHSIIQWMGENTKTSHLFGKAKGSCKRKK